MTNIKTWLGAILAIQLVLTAGVWWHSHNQSQNNLPQTLLDIRWEDVNNIMITSKSDSVSLGQENEQWQLLAHELPALNSKVNALLEKLEKLHVNWPVASHKSSHSRFEVNEENFQRRVALHNGNSLLGEILIGSSPGLKQLHIRKGGNDQVYVVELELVDIPPKTTDWLDKSLLAVKNIDRIEGDNFALVQTGNNWVLSHKGPTVLINQDDPMAENEQKKFENLISNLEKLRVTGLAKDKPDLFDSSAIKLNVTSGNNTWRYTFHENNGQHFIQRNDFNSLFTFSKSDYEKITQSSQLILNSQKKQKTVGEEKE